MPVNSSTLAKFHERAPSEAPASSTSGSLLKVENTALLSFAEACRATIVYKFEQGGSINDVYGSTPQVAHCQ